MYTQNQTPVRWMLICLLCCLAALSNAQTAQVYRLPWVPVAGTNIPMVRIAFANGQSRLFVLDTGASTSLIDRKTVTALNLTVTQHTDPATQRDFDLVYCPVDLGPKVLSLPKAYFFLADLSALQQADPAIAGILGTDLLTDYSLRMDYSHKQVDLIFGSVKGTVNEPRIAIKLPLTKLRDDYTILGSVNNIKVDFIIDTGADTTFLNQPDVLQALKPKAFLGESQSAALSESGVGSRLIPERIVKLDSLTIDKLTFPDPVVKEGGLLALACGLGSDILQRFFVLIDYPGRTLYLTRDPDYKEKLEPKANDTKTLQQAVPPAAPIVLPFKPIPRTATPLVTVSLNGGPPHLFLLNPGVSACFIDQAFVQSAKIPIKKIDNGGKTQDDIVVVDRMTFPAPVPLNADKIPIFVVDLSQLRRSVGEEVIGVLGTNFLSAFKVRVDFSKREITLFSKGVYVPGEKQALPVPLQEEGGTYSLEATVDGQPARFFVDFIQDTNLQEDSLFAKLQPIVKLQDILADGGKGDQTLRLKSVNVAGEIWSNPIVSHSANPDDKMNILGIDFFERFYVTLDLSAKRLYLEHDPNYREDPTTSMGMGFHAELDASGVVRVTGILSPGPATAVGLKAGDEILEVNGQSPAKMPIATFFASMNRAEGALITVKIQRKGEEKPREFHWKITKLL